jgi:hypothetical protein
VATASGVAWAIPPEAVGTPPRSGVPHYAPAMRTILIIIIVLILLGALGGFTMRGRR